MLLAARRASAFASGMDRATFEADERTQFAVVRALEILGEAASRASDDEMASAPTLAWTELRGLRTILAHEYFRIDLDVVWDVVHNELAGIISLLEAVVPAEGEA